MQRRPFVSWFICHISWTLYSYSTVPRLPLEGFVWSRTLVVLLKTVHESAAVCVPGALVAVLPLNDVLPALRAIGEPPLLSSIHCRMGRGTTVGLTRLLLPCGSHLIGRCRVRCRLLPR